MIRLKNILIKVILKQRNGVFHMKVCVIGAGVMGPGIAQVFLMGGHDVVLNDISEDALQKGCANIEMVLQQMQKAEILTKEPAQYLQTLTTTTDLQQAVAGAVLVVEAIPEKMELKQPLYQQLDVCCDADTMIVSNTSSLPLPEIFPDFRSGNFCVAHFFNPPPIIPLVEVVKNDKANPEKIAWLRKTLEDCGKTVVVVNKFIKGFLINRLQTALAREALYLVNEGIVSAEDMDNATKAAIGFKSVWQGFFETMDFIGLDTVAFVYNIIYPDLCNAENVPEVVLQKVQEGKLGTKSGEGFYAYDAEQLKAVNETRIEALLTQLKLWNAYQNKL